MGFLNVPISTIPPEGSTDAKIAIVGEAPGAEEDKTKRPFTGPAGGILDTCLHTAGLTRSGVYLTTFIKEYNKQSRLSKYYSDKRGLTLEGGILRDQLVEELKSVKANVIVTLGNAATEALTGKAGVMKQRGSILPTLDGLFQIPRKVIPTINPGASLRGKYIFRYYIMHDLKRAKEQSLFSEIRRKERRLVVNMTFEEAREWIRYYEKQPLVAADIEVVNHEVSCLGLCADSSLAISIPFYKQWTEEEEVILWKDIARFLANHHSKIFQNAMFDTAFLLMRNHIPTNGRVEDTMIAQHLMYPDFPKGLDFITSIHTEEPYYKDEGKEWNNPSNWEDFRRYNAKDAIVTFEAWLKLEKEIDETGHRWGYDFTIALLEPLLAMTVRGILVNRETLKETRIQAKKEQEATQIELDKVVGHPLNANSPKQCQAYFYIEKGIPPYTKAVKKDGRYEKRITTDDKAMQRLARGTAIRAGLPAAKLVQKIRGLSKLIGTYLEINLDEDGRIRCSYNPRGTVSGRLSSSKNIFGNGTNLQNLPETFKRFLVADPGYILVELDKRQAEWVIVAYDSGDANMIKVIREGLDPHTYTAFLMSGVNQELIKREAKVIGHSTEPGEITHLRATKFDQTAKAEFDNAILLPRNMSLRQCGKKANHGLNYDEGYKTFALTNEILEKEAKFMIDRYHAVYPGIKQWHKQIQQQLEKDRTLLNFFGRKRRFLDAWGDLLFKSAYAHVPQSTVSDILNRGLIHIYRDITPHMARVELLAQVHDSILIQYPINHIRDLGRVVHTMKQHLEPQISIHGRSFTIKTDMKIGKNWGEMVDVSYVDTAAQTQVNIFAEYNNL